MHVKETIIRLREELHRHNYDYYVRNMPTISDQAFDDKMRQLSELEEANPEYYDANSPTQRVGSDSDNRFEQTAHRYPMLSLGNTYNKTEVEAFYNRVKGALDGEAFEVCCELKFDGLSISLTYEDGRLLRAVTRGDGVKGDDVTENVRTIRSIPLQLNTTDAYPDFFEIRGEIFMPWVTFEALNAERERREEPLFANPRNAAAGTLKSKNSKTVAERRLDAVFYYLLGEQLPTDSHLDNVQAAAAWGFKVSEATRLAKTLDEVVSFIDYWNEERKNLPYATDGVVLKVNSLTQQQRLGYTAKSPRWAISYKFQPEREKTRLEEVTFQVGRTGAVTPVANMVPVQLSGTLVRRASLHNEDVMTQLDLHIGDMVYVEKAGEIIPQIVGVELKDRGAALGDRVRFATHCPECGTPLVRYEGEAVHYCPNALDCPPQIKGKIEHFISRDAMNIESLGPETIDDYYDRGLIRDAADLFEIKVEDISGTEGTRRKSAEKIVDGIAKSKQVPFDRVLYALGIRMVGKVVAKQLAKHFKNIEQLSEAQLDDFLQIEGVGETIAQNVRAYFAEERNAGLVARLKAAGVQMAMEEGAAEEGEASQTLEGKSVVISGVFRHHSREEYKALIERHGGKNVGSISAKTSFVLAGENMGPAKLEKARVLNISVLSEDDFLELLKEK